MATLKHARFYLDQGFTSCFSAAATKPRLDVLVRDAIAAGDFAVLLAELLPWNWKPALDTPAAA